MKIEDWRESIELQRAWSSTWNEQHMALGLALLKENIFEATVIVPPGTEALVAGALRDAAREGARCILKAIELMGTPPTESAAQMPPAYKLVIDDGKPLDPKDKKI